MNTQDKEFDSLFHSKLNDFETEPSANVWENIDAGLRNGNRKKILVPLLSAAASIIVLVAAGVLLIPHHIKNVADHTDKGRIAKRNVPAKTPVVSPLNKTVQIARINTDKKTKLPIQTIALQPVKKQPAIVQPQITGATALQQPAIKQPVQEVIAAVPPKHDDVVPPKQIDTVVLIAAYNANTPVVKPTQIVVPDKQLIARSAVQSAKKHHVHSLGDMINTVIAAVDKRKDKLIEFSDTDYDESVITGVNLGIITVKKQN